MNPQVMKQALMSDLDSLNDKYFQQVSSAVNNLIDLKVALNEHDVVLDDQIDDFKSRIVSLPLTNFFQGAADGNIQAM